MEYVKIPVKTICRRKARRIVLPIAADTDGLSIGANRVEDAVLHSEPVPVDDVVNVVALKCVQRRPAACCDVELSEELQHLEELLYIETADIEFILT
jgi:hypothetical protein